MNMHWADWLIVAVPMIVVGVIGYKTQKYCRGVADFMTGGRAAGRYLLTTAEYMGGMGLISAVAIFESQYKSGLVFSGPWGVLLTPIMLALTLTGYLIYRYRETRVMTMAQFFEVRYSKRFRLFTGMLAAAAGIINYGIFPAVGGRFFVYFCGLPETTPILGYSVPTFGLVMAFFLSLALVLVLGGGQLTILVTDAVQAIFSYVLFAVVAITIFVMFNMDQMTYVLENRPSGESFINPWDIGKLQDFNLWFWIIGAFGGIYSMMAWQGGHAFNASAATPQEAKMGKILGTFRGGFSTLMFTFVVIAALVVLQHPQFAAESAAIKGQITQIENPALQTQMTVPMALAYLLPPGVKGCFCALMLFLLVTTDVSYLHSWGSIVVQDVILPFRKKPFTPQTQILLIRLAIVGVAVYAFLFSLLFRQNDYILMFFALTGTLYLGGAGACIVGGLYWKKGTAAGAWAAMLSGVVIATIGYVCQRYWPTLQPMLLHWLPDNQWLLANPEKFPVNSQWLWGLAMVMAVTLYILISIVTCRENFNLDRMLHRGQYALGTDGKPLPALEKTPLTWRTFIGIDPAMTRGDRRLTYFAFGWSYFWWFVGMVVLVWNIVPAWRWPTHWFTQWFFINNYVVGIALGLVTTIWFTWGGIRDLGRLFKTLRTQTRNVFDDGRVVGHHNAGERPAEMIAAAELELPGQEKQRA
jgi:SSS family solute:Na+ symporter